jgi:ribonuclease R
MRDRNGALNFDIPEARVIVDEKGNPIDVVLRERFDAEKLIEQFMLIANETVASCINQLDLPFIYRIHDVPKQDKLRQFKKILKNTSYNINIRNNQKVTPKVLQSIMDEVDDYAISTILLRMMAKAKYDVFNIGHYGLASECYTHFTSPIRRYPDLLVHRLLKKYLIKGEVSIEDQKNNLNMIATRAEQSSKRERDAIECEYEVNDMKMAEYMENHIGETFIGTVSSVTNFGMFVTLDNTIEGLIRLTDMKDDYYDYDNNTLSLLGRHTKQKYQLGDKVKVKCVNASKQKKEIDFIVSSKNNKNMVKYSHTLSGRGKHEKRRTKNNRKK